MEPEEDDLLLELEKEDETAISEEASEEFSGLGVVNLKTKSVKSLKKIKSGQVPKRRRKSGSPNQQFKSIQLPYDKQGGEKRNLQTPEKPSPMKRGG